MATEITLEEKLGRLRSRWVGNDVPGKALSFKGPQTDSPDSPNVAPMQDAFAAAGSPPLEEGSQHGLGHLTRIYGSAPIRPAAGADFTGQDLRRIVEPGNIDVLIGTSAANLPCRAQVRLTGPVQVVGPGRRLVTPTDVSAATESVPA